MKTKQDFPSINERPPEGVRVDGTKVNLDVTVTNTGDAYSGKEIAQVYVSSPVGELHKEYQSLAAFGKTNLASSAGIPASTNS